MFINTALCPRLSQIRSMMKSTTKYQTYFNSTYADFVRLNKILKYSPQTATNSSIAFVLAADVFLPIECNNKPKLCSDGTCVTDGDVALSSSNTQLEFQDLRHFSPYSQEFNRLTGGAMLSQLLDELSYQINYSANAKSSDEQSTRPVRMSVYSGHDETIAGILSIFKVKNLEAYLPPYASSIITEVWQNDLDKKYYLRIMYNGKTVALLPNSETQALWCDMNKCDWDTYRDYISKYVPTDLYQECKVKQ
ncbi:Prostatic acid phosphatase [Zancudomyces culisetae]|uniref:Prostatic acid phosphatase n=1 Tax=Zancudomyces culisetae TaxID=1213189 RepID=A0A1R1PL79_ZANCU|nr:Prostatic acid phosphatase [Zancudomyces culisetae]|eukprot:OMH81715.1 Prostatic acid phosphatase [Zancudomyces culisetae]